MNLWGALFSALIAVCFSLCLRTQHKELTVLVGIATIVIVFICTGNGILAAMETLMQYFEDTTLSDTFSVLLKALGISAVVRIAADICTEAGESTLASQIETLGTVEIVLLSIPMALRLLKIAEQLLL